MRTGLSVLTLIVAGSVAISWDGLHDQIQPADVGVVLASKIEKDGTPEKSMVARLDKAVEMYKKGMYPFLIASGGIDRNGWHEADLMKDYLVEHGVPQEKILADNNGTNTYYTCRTASAYMAARHLKSVMIVTQYFHISRTRLAMRRFGVPQVYSAHADYFSIRDITWVPRDAVGYVWYWFRTYSNISSPFFKQ